MKKILFLSVILLLVNSCNGQEKKEVENTLKVNTVKTKQKQTIQVDKIALNTSVDTILKGFNLDKNDNYSTTVNLNLDYEEFWFSPDNNFKFNDLNIGKITSLVIFYLKKDNNAFVYELELENNNNCESLIAEFNKKFGKQTFYKKRENTKKNPLFLDENGEYETDHITEEAMKWKDDKNNATYFVIYKNNLDTKENKIFVSVISNSSKKFAEWIDYRSLDMVFPE